MSGARAAAGSVALVILLAACLPQATPTAPPVATPTVAAPASATATESVSAAPTASAEATASPAPSLSLDPPEERDERVVSVSVEPRVGPEGGEILVTVASAAEARIDDLVLRWPTALADSLFLSPFVPSADRIRDDGPPLVQPWTKWVIGPGERGEPDGTTSLGYGPLLPGATLAIPLYVTRVSTGPVAFDLQVLAGNTLLTLEGGRPAELRIEVP